MARLRYFLILILLLAAISNVHSEGIIETPAGDLYLRPTDGKVIIEGDLSFSDVMKIYLDDVNRTYIETSGRLSDHGDMRIRVNNWGGSGNSPFIHYFLQSSGKTGVYVYNNQGQYTRLLKESDGRSYLDGSGGDFVIDTQSSQYKIRMVQDTVPSSNAGASLGSSGRCWDTVYYYNLYDCGSPTEKFSNRIHALEAIERLSTAILSNKSSEYHKLIPKELKGVGGSCGNEAIFTDEVINAHTLAISELSQRTDNCHECMEELSNMKKRIELLEQQVFKLKSQQPKYYSLRLSDFG